METQPGDARPSERAAEVAREEGQLIGAARRSGGRMSARKSLDAAAEVLRELGYEPQSEAACVKLRNCPFHAVVDVAPALVCGLNDALIGGILDGLGAADSVAAALDGVAPDCCVTVAKR